MTEIRKVDGVIYRSLGDEVVAVDPTSHEAFALTPDAAAVWLSMGEGPVTVSVLADRTGLVPAAVGRAITALAAAGLVVETRPGSRSLSRRAVLAGGAVGTAGLVASIVLPTAAAAASGPVTSPGGSGNPPVAGNPPVGGSPSGGTIPGGVVSTPGGSFGSGTTGSGVGQAATGTQAATGNPATTGALAVTGAPIGQEVAAAAALLGVGGAAVAAARLRPPAGEEPDVPSA